MTQGKHPFQVQTNQSRAQTWHPLLGSHTVVHHPPTWIIPGPGPKQLGTASIPQSQSNVFKAANPKSAYLPCSLFPVKTTTKAMPTFLCIYSASWQTLVLFHGTPHGILCLLFLRKCEYKLLPSRQLFPCLKVLPNLAKTKSRYP